MTRSNQQATNGLIKQGYKILLKKWDSKFHRNYQRKNDTNPHLSSKRTYHSFSFSISDDQGHLIEGSHFPLRSHQPTKLAMTSNIS